MFLIKDPKKEAASIVLALGQPEGEESSDEGKLSAADDLLKAIEKKDSKALVMAFENLYSLCCEEPMEEEEAME